MKVKECEKCRYKKRHVWSTYYIPRDYHPIGMSHAYAYCALHQKRVRDVKKCEHFINANQISITDIMELASAR